MYVYVYMYICIYVYIYIYIYIYTNGTIIDGADVINCHFRGRDSILHDDRNTSKSIFA